MASKGLQTLSQSLRGLRISASSYKEPLTQCLTPQRTMATETSMPFMPFSESQSLVSHIFASKPPPNPLLSSQDTTVLATIHKFPSMEPSSLTSYPSKHLYLPLRRDILHRAIVFEGDFTRQGTASTKTRHEVHGSHRKIRPQKGTGRARLGTKQSPMLRGGGKSFGPHPRDFSSALPRKMYDLAWRTALSWRYRRGELVICEDGMEIEHAFGRYASMVLKWNRWGKEHGRSLFVTESKRENLFAAMNGLGTQGRCLEVDDVDVKDLLELGRVVIERSALDVILEEHQSDLVSGIRQAVAAV